VIVKDIHDHSAIVAMICVQTFAALFCNRMGVCIGVNFSMEHYALLNPFREMVIFITANTVCYEITNGYFIITKRKKYMRQKIHYPNLQIRGSVKYLIRVYLQKLYART